MILVEIAGLVLHCTSMVRVMCIVSNHRIPRMRQSMVKPFPRLSQLARERTSKQFDPELRRPIADNCYITESRRGQHKILAARYTVSYRTCAPTR
jgi:hypothetical protein